MTSTSIGDFGTDLAGNGRRSAGKQFLTATARKGAANSLRLTVFNSSGTRSEENIPLMSPTEVTFDDQRQGESQFLVQKLPHTVRLRTSSLTSDASSQRSKGVDSGNSSLIDSSSTDSYPDFGGGRSRTTSTSRSYQNLTGDRLDVHENFYENDGTSQKTVPVDTEHTADGSSQMTSDLMVSNQIPPNFNLQNETRVNIREQKFLSPAGKLNQNTGDCARKRRSRDFSSDEQVCHCPRHSLSNIKENDVIGPPQCQQNVDVTRLVNDKKISDNVVENVEFRRAFSTGNILESLNARNLNGSQPVAQRALPSNCGKTANVSHSVNDSSASSDCSQPEPSGKGGSETSHKSCAERIKPNDSQTPESVAVVKSCNFPGNPMSNTTDVYASDCSDSLSVCVCSPTCSLSNDLKTTKDYFTVSSEHEQSQTSTSGSDGASFGLDERVTQTSSAGRGQAANLNSVLGYGAPWSYSGVNTKAKHSHDHTQPLQVLVPRLTRDIPPCPQAQNTAAVPPTKHSPINNELKIFRNMSDTLGSSPSCSPHGNTSAARDLPENVARDYGSYAPGHNGCCHGGHKGNESHFCGCVGSPLNRLDISQRNAFSSASHKHGLTQSTPSQQEIYLHTQRDNSRVTFRNQPCEGEGHINGQTHDYSDASSLLQGNASDTQFYQYPILGYEQCRRGFARSSDSPYQRQFPMPQFYPDPISNSVVQSKCGHSSSSSQCSQLAGGPQAVSTAGHSPQMSAPDAGCFDDPSQAPMTLRIPMTCFEPDFFSPQNVSPGSHHSMPSSIDSGQAGNNQPSLQNTSQTELIKAGQRLVAHPLVSSDREIPDYKILCIVAALFNPVLGMLAYFCNSYARQNFSAYRYNRANSFYLASITLSTTGIFLTLTGAALLAAHSVTTAAPPPLNNTVSTLVRPCFSNLEEVDESFMKFFEMDHKLYCELSQKLTIMDALKHYQILDSNKRHEHRANQERERNRQNQNLTMAANSSTSSLLASDDGALYDLRHGNGSQTTAKTDDGGQLLPTDLLDYDQTDSGMLHDTVQSSEDNKPVVAPGLEGEYKEFQKGHTHVKMPTKTP